MKTTEELNTLKEEVENLSSKLQELSEDELAQVVGGLGLIEALGAGMGLGAGQGMGLGASKLLGIHCRDGQDLVGLNPHRRGEEELIQGPTS